MQATGTTAEKNTLQDIGEIILRYGLVVVFLWIGLLKFNEYEAKGIEPFVANSPLFLAKDLVLPGASCWTAGEALRAARYGDVNRV